MTSTNLPGGRRSFKRASPTCPIGLCPHPVLVHDVDEIPGPRIERCTVQDCHCSGVAEPEDGDDREQIARWAEFVHHRFGERAHVLPLTPTPRGVRATLCGKTPALSEKAWRGTRTPDEQDHARQMPLCVRCANLLVGRAA